MHLSQAKQVVILSLLIPTLYYNVGEFLCFLFSMHAVKILSYAFIVCPYLVLLFLCGFGLYVHAAL